MAKRDRRLYLRGDTWWARIRSGGKSKRMSTGCKDYEAASLRANELEKQEANPEYKASVGETLETAINRYLRHLVTNETPAGTFLNYRTKLGHVVRVMDPKRPLNQINPALTYDYVEKRLAEGAKANSLDKELKALYQVLKLAKHLGKYSGDVSALKPMGFSANYKPREGFVKDYPELQALILQLPSIRAAQVCYMVATGARLAESARAERTDVNPEMGLILVRGTKTEGSWRQVPILDIFRPALDFALKYANGASARLSGLMFEPWDATHLIPNACKRAGIDKYTPHDMRRTAASWLRQAGVEPDLIGLFLGHSDGRQVEQIYGKMPAERLAESMAARLGQNLGNLGSDECAENVPAGPPSNPADRWRTMLKPLELLPSATASFVTPSSTCTEESRTREPGKARKRAPKPRTVPDLNTIVRPVKPRTKPKP